MSAHRFLLLAYDYPPNSGLGGSLRSGAFARYLPNTGWVPHVVALDEGQVETDGVDRLASLTPWKWPYEVTPYGWAVVLRKYLRKSKAEYDLVYVSCPPYPQALAASDYAKRQKLPLVVDFRDAWSLDPYREGSRLKRWLYRHVFPRWERKLLAQTDLLLLNTPSTLAAYRQHYPQYVSKMAWLPNGFDGTVFPVSSTLPKREEMQLLYAGRFGIGARSPGNLLAGLTLAREQGCKVRLRVLGNQLDSVKGLFQEAVGNGAVELAPQVEYAQAVRQMCEADALVLVQAPTASAIQPVAGKTFDYLRAGRPVLAIGPDGDNLDLVRRHAFRYECPADRPQSIAEAITMLWRDWRQQSLRNSKVDSLVVQRYERKALAAQLAGHFDRLIAKRS